MKVKIKINKPFLNFAKGRILEIESDNEGTPVDVFWRRRLKDAKQDNCCEIVPVEKVTIKSTLKSNIEE